MDRDLVGIAVVLAGLLVFGQVVADLLGRVEVSNAALVLDSVSVVAPTAACAMLARRPTVAWLRWATPAVSAVALVVVAARIEERPRAAAMAVPAALVLIACRPLLASVRVPVDVRLWCSGLLAVVVGAGLLLSAQSGQAASVSLAGGTVADGTVAIGEADARFLTDTLGVAERMPGSRCYFVEAEATTSGYRDEVACGPLRRPAPAPPSDGEPDEADGEGDEAAEEATADRSSSSAATALWDIYPVSVVRGRIRLDDPTVGQAVDEARLWRPDGLRPPAVAEGSEAGPLTVTNGFAALLDGEPRGEVRDGGGYVLVGGGRVTVVALAHPESVVGPDGDERRAPDAYRLVAAKVQREDDQGATFAIVSGEDRLDVSHVVSSGAWSGARWLVVVVGDDSTQPSLEVSYRGRSQRLSLATGQRAGGDPLLYDPPTQAMGVEVDGVTADVTVPAATPYPAQAFVGSYTVVGAQLTTFEENRGWAPPGQAWLVVGIDGLRSPLFVDGDIEPDQDVALHLDTARSLALLIEGAAVPVGPVGVGPTEAADLSVVFAVPDTVRRATFRMTPTWLLISDGRSVDVVGPPVEVAIALG